MRRSSSGTETITWSCFTSELKAVFKSVDQLLVSLLEARTLIIMKLNSKSFHGLFSVFLSKKKKSDYGLS